jgi:hypothetical protein
MTGALSLQNNVSNSTSATLKITGSSNASQDNFILFGDNATSYPIAMGFDNSENTFKIARSANDDLNSNIYFKMSSTGVISAPTGVELGGGLTAATANTLDDYEEGTWTPVLTDLTNNATMHSLNAGVYTKIGRVVHCTANVRTTSLGSVSGNLYLSGFPFSTPNTNGNHGAGSVANAENMSITAGHAITLYYGKNSNSARFDIYDHSGGVTVLQASEWTSDGQATIQVTYST